MLIWKYALEVVDRQKLLVPEGSVPLTAQIQHGRLMLWAQVNEAAPMGEALWIAIYGTGNPMPSDPGRYLSTFQLEDGALVFHVYQLP